MNGKFGRTKERLDELMLYGSWIGVSSISQVAWWKWRKCSGRRCFFISNLIFYFSLKLLRENHDFSLKVAATGGKKFHVIFFSGTEPHIWLPYQWDFYFFFHSGKRVKLCRRTCLQLRVTLCELYWENSSKTFQNTDFSCLQFSISEPQTCWGDA